MRQLQASDFTKNFKTNVGILEDVQGARCDALPRAVFRLAKNRSSTFLPTEPGTFITAAMIRHLIHVHGERSTIIGERERACLQAFFGELMESPVGEHPTLDVLARGDADTEAVLHIDGTDVRAFLSDPSRGNEGDQREARHTMMQLMEFGAERAAEPDEEGGWIVRPHVQEFILDYFKTTPNRKMDGIYGAYDKIPILWDGWEEWQFEARGIRVVPPATVRRGACIKPRVVLMPSYVNIGAYVGSETLVDTWVTVGSCAQIGRGVHLSGNVGIGGVLEPPGQQPTIVEDGAFIGSRCIIVEGVRVGKEAVLGAGVVLTASTHILDVSQPEVREYKGYIPTRSVVIPGMRPKDFPGGEYSVPCALIIGQRTASTDRKTSLNEAIRTFNVSV